jgi:hypothetical protein
MMKQNMFVVYLIMVFTASSSYSRCFAQDDQPVAAAAAAQPAEAYSRPYSSGQHSSLTFFALISDYSAFDYTSLGLYIYLVRDVCVLAVLLLKVHGSITYIWMA